MKVTIGLAVVIALLIGGWAVFQRSVEPAEPSAFYTPPATLPAGPPGTIVRRQPVTAPAGRQVWRILYTSTDPEGRPVAVSGVVVAPDGPAPAGGWPVVAWAHGTTGVASRCAPSLEGGAGIELVPELDRLIAAGTVVAISDYPGLGTPGPHPYLVGDSEGRAVLDSVRAARGLLAGDTSPTYAVFGHSQGGHAALFAGIVAADYAPELKLTGIAAMAPPTDLAQLLERDSRESDGIALTALAITAWKEYYPGLEEGDIVHAEAIPLISWVGERCIETTAQGLADLPDLLALRLRFLSTDPADAKGWAALFPPNSPGPTPPAVPVLVAQGLTDTLVRPDVTEAYVARACQAGAAIELDTYAGVDHFGVRTVAAPAVVTWLLDRVAGTPAPTGCTTKAD